MLEPATEPTGQPLDVVTEEHLRGVFAPVDDEIDASDLPVRGELPAELAGTYVRNGPNPQFPPAGSYAHPFDGDGMLHALRFEAGKVRYRNRWVLTRGLVEDRHAGRALHGGMLAPTTTGVKNVANTSVVEHAGKLLALWEGGLPYELTEGCATVGECDFGGALPGAMTAHPKLDPVWDELCWFRYAVDPPYLVYGVVDPRGRIADTRTIDVPRPVMMHDFAVTDQHVVFFDSPVVLDPAAAATGAPFAAWREEHGTRIGVMPRDEELGTIRWFPVEHRFVLHVLNAWTEGETVTVDYVHRDRFDPGQTGGDATPPPRLMRTVVELGRGTVHDERLDDRVVELPRIDDRRSGLSYRYGYVAAVTHGGAGPAGAAFDTLVRYDFRADEVAEQRFPEGIVVGEPQFVPRPGGTAEDDGWVLALTYDTTRDSSELVVIAAADFAAEPVARIPLPQRVPAGLHGTWIPAR